MTKTNRACALLVLMLGAACGSSASDTGGEGGVRGDDGTTGASSSSGGGDGSSSGTASSSGSSGGGSSGGASSSGASSGSSGTSGSSGAASSSSSGSSGADGSTAYDYSVYQHHKNPSRNGVYIEPTFTKSAVSTMHKTTFMGTVSTSVYAQPLYVENGPGGNPVFIVGTEQNHLTVFNANTGAVVWDDCPAAGTGCGPTAIGQPVTGGLPCGNISTLGITGTPYIDTSSGQAIVYFDAMTTPDGNTTAKHLVYAVKLSDGSTLPNWPVDVNAKVSGFTSRTQNERGALQLVKGVLYVPYGGLWGDCGTYYGWVVGIPLSSPQSPVGWHTTTSMAGIWASGSLPTDGTSLFPVTGNSSATTSTSAWAGSEAVIRLAAGTTGATFSGATADYYTPSDWRSLDGPADNDLGGGSDVLFDMPGAAYPHLLAQGGKDGNFYLLDRDTLGGEGGSLVTPLHVATGNLKGAPAVYTTSMGTYVAFYTTGGGVGCPNTGGTGNVVVVKVTAGSPPSAAVAWCAPEGNLGSPMVTTTDGTSNAIVWDASTTLWGFDGDTGAVVAGGTNTALASSMQYFNTPISAHGKIVVGVNGELSVFTP
jgi:hypothetical protein